MPTPLNIADACNLPPGEFNSRRNELIPFFKTAQKIEELPDGLRFHFTARPGLLAELAKIMDQEKDCCAFFRMQLTVEPNPTEIILELTAPPGVIDALRKP